MPAQPGIDSERAGDAVLATALVVVANVVAMGVIGVVVLALRATDQPTPLLLSVAALAAGSLASSYIPDRWLRRRHPRRTLLAASIVACACLCLSGYALRPWPDLLSDEMVGAGQLRFLVEMLKTPVPLLSGIVAGFGVLRYARHNRQCAASLG